MEVLSDCLEDSRKDSGKGKESGKEGKDGGKNGGKDGWRGSKGEGKEGKDGWRGKDGGKDGKDGGKDSWGGKDGKDGKGKEGKDGKGDGKDRKGKGSKDAREKGDEKGEGQGHSDLLAVFTMCSLFDIPSMFVSGFDVIFLFYLFVPFFLVGVVQYCSTLVQGKGKRKDHGSYEDGKGEKNGKGPGTPLWWFQRFVIFTPSRAEMIQFDSYFFRWVETTN